MTSDPTEYDADEHARELLEPIAPDDVLAYQPPGYRHALERVSAALETASEVSDRADELEERECNLRAALQALVDAVDRATDIAGRAVARHARTDLAHDVCNALAPLVEALEQARAEV